MVARRCGSPGAPGAAAHGDGPPGTHHVVHLPRAGQGPYLPVQGAEQRGLQDGLAQAPQEGVQGQQAAAQAPPRHPEALSLPRHPGGDRQGQVRLSHPRHARRLQGNAQSRRRRWARSGSRRAPTTTSTVEAHVRQSPPPAGPRSNDLPDRANRNYAIKCPNSKNLIAVIGDTRPEPTPLTPMLPKCVQLCNLQIEGLGKEPEDVLIVGDRKKLDVLRIDRADGIYLRNFAIEQRRFNNVDLVEVERLPRIRRSSRATRRTTGSSPSPPTHGLYDHDVAYDNGDSGLYPGSSHEGLLDRQRRYRSQRRTATCEATGCGDLRRSRSARSIDCYGNTLGYSGTAGNSTYVHDNKFYDNATGLTTDSFAVGAPRDAAGVLPLGAQRDLLQQQQRLHAPSGRTTASRRRSRSRKKDIVCPQFQTAVGTGRPDGRRQPQPARRTTTSTTTGATGDAPAQRPGARCAATTTRHTSRTPPTGTASSTT